MARGTLATVETLAWEPAHEGNEGTLWGFDERRRLIAQIAFYDVVGGRGPGWVGYVRGERVSGRCQGPEVARAAVERALRVH